MCTITQNIFLYVGIGINLLPTSTQTLSKHQVDGKITMPFFFCVRQFKRTASLKMQVYEMMLTFPSL